MAKFQRYAYNEIDDDEYYYIVETDSGTDRKRFDNEEEARTYYRHLQQLDDQHRAVEQIESLQRSCNRTNKVIQILDPEYEEWLRFKKETDPAFIKWKKEKELKEQKKKELEELEQKQNRIQKELKIRQEQENSCLTIITEFKSKIRIVRRDIIACENLIKDIQKLYQIRCKPSEQFYAKDDYGEGEIFQFGILDDKYIKNIVNINIPKEIIILSNLESKVLEVEKLSNRIDVIAELERLFNSKVEHFHMWMQEIEILGKYVYDIIKMQNKVKNFKVHGFFGSIKINRIREKYLKDNLAYYSLAVKIQGTISTMKKNFPYIHISDKYNSYIWYPCCCSLR